MKRIVAAGILILALAGCSGGEPSTSSDRFVDMVVNGTRCIVYIPSSTPTGVQMECDFATPAPGPIDTPELSPPPPPEEPAP